MTRAFSLPSRLLFRQAFWKPMCTLGRFHQLPRLGSCGMSHACSEGLGFRVRGEWARWSGWLGGAPIGTMSGTWSRNDLLQISNSCLSLNLETTDSDRFRIKGPNQQLLCWN